MANTVLVWLRQDLRLADNPALYHACQLGTDVTIIPVFIDDPTPTSTSQLGAASRVWLHHSLHDLAVNLAQRGSQLIMRQGHALSVLQSLIQETQATHVYWNRVYEPACLARDIQIKQFLRTQCEVKSFNASLINEPWDVLKADGTPYKVFTPFWKAMLKHGIQHALLPEPMRLPAPSRFPHSVSLDALGLLPNIRWDVPMMNHWQVGETAAMHKLHQFLHNAVEQYKTERDFPAQANTSKLSPHLHFGEISPRQIVHYTLQTLMQQPAAEKGIQHFLQEVGWREFAYHLLYHFPHTVERALDERFNLFPWAENYQTNLQAWQQGQTGFPIIDAGMRELWQTGWMHNRVRMIVASLLTKNLLIPWQIGEQWFRNTLVDADLANNVLGWQWTAGCGADAAPYFRIFNPILQSQKFDPNGDYIRRFVQELQQRDTQSIHFPKAFGEGLKDYPMACVDLKTSRTRALEYFNQLLNY